jgi:hypothetical protein
MSVGIDVEVTHLDAAGCEGVVAHLHAANNTQPVVAVCHSSSMHPFAAQW